LVFSLTQKIAIRMSLVEFKYNVFLLKFKYYFSVKKNGFKLSIIRFKMKNFTFLLDFQTPLLIS